MPTIGAGAGILVFTTLSLLDPRPLNESNAVKALCTTLTNGVALPNFIVAGAVSWPAVRYGGGDGGDRRLRPGPLSHGELVRAHFE